MRFATALAVSGSFSQCKWLPVTFFEEVSQEWLRFASVQHALWKEVSYNMHFREIADARNAVFFNTEVAPNLASQALGNDRCGTSSRHSRIMPLL